jgi:hypothetical protein
MQIIGFNFTKISAEKAPSFKRTSINTHIQFSDMEKEKNDLLKDSDIIKLKFNFSVNYGDTDKEEEKMGCVMFEGLMVLSTNKDETKEFTKSWKKKQIPKEYTVPLYNFILRRCSIKALQLEEDVSLPMHLPFPQVKPKSE